MFKQNKTKTQIIAPLATLHHGGIGE